MDGAPGNPRETPWPWSAPLGRPIRLAVLISGGGTTMLNLADRAADGRLPAELSLVLASNGRAAGLDRAAARKLPTTVVERKPFANDVQGFSDVVFGRVRDSGAELVVLAGFLSLLRIPADFTHRVVNIHPSLLPSFGGPGMFGRRVHEAVIAHGCKVTGCTVHLADDTYDTGPILTQRCCAVEPGDTPETLAARVFIEECEAYPDAIAAVAEGRVSLHGRVARVRADA
jgi:phosphoribosylglycinamide formyltransferase 1